MSRTIVGRCGLRGWGPRGTTTARRSSVLVESVIGHLAVSDGRGVFTGAAAAVVVVVVVKDVRH